MPLYVELKEQFDSIIAEYKAAMSDGQITITEVWRMLMLVITGFCNIVKQQAADNVSLAERKAAVMQAIHQFWDEVIVPYDIKGIPNWIEGMVERVAINNLDPVFSQTVDYVFAVFGYTAKPLHISGAWGDAQITDPCSPAAVVAACCQRKV